MYIVQAQYTQPRPPFPLVSSTQIYTTAGHSGSVLSSPTEWREESLPTSGPPWREGGTRRPGRSGSSRTGSVRGGSLLWWGRSWLGGRVGGRSTGGRGGRLSSGGGCLGGLGSSPCTRRVEENVGVHR